MKFLHTADLHLGRSLHERPLLEDQRFMLDSLTAELEKDDYAALIIAGDIYDRSIPSPEAMELLGGFLGKLKRRLPDLAVMMASGNHDSPERLGYGDALFSTLGIHIVSDPEKSFEPVLIEKDGEKCAVFILPFLTPGCLRINSENDAENGRPLRSQQDLAREAASRLNQARIRALAGGADTAVLIAHLFAAGGAESESERSFLGTAERVDAALFEAFDYVALGHLHRSQKAGKNAYYSGSPLAYSFDEAEHDKCVLAVDVRLNAETEIRRIPARPFRRVARLCGPFDSFMESDAHAERKDEYLEIALSDGHLVENPLALLRTRFPNLLSVRQDVALASGGTNDRKDGGISILENRRNVADDFSSFLTQLYGEADEKKLDLFRRIAEEVSHETA